jgi:CRISPR-associated protein Cas1
MTTLLDLTLQPGNLRRAWDDVLDNGGAPGVDDITLAAWNRAWEARLVTLAADVRAGRYRPHPLRERQIPKSSGDGLRLLRIPTITDRVLQRAALQVLQPLYEPRFRECSYGYRPGRGVADAVRAISRLRRDGFEWVLDADIDDFFNQIDHRLLMGFLAGDLPDDTLLPLIHAWNTVDALTEAADRGIPMGAPISPLLANVFLHRLDEAILDRPSPLVRYADDFIVLTDWPLDRPDLLRFVGDELAQLRLAFEPHKTRLTGFDEGFDFLGVHFEETWYWYWHDDRRIEIRDDHDDHLLDHYTPRYE